MSQKQVPESFPPYAYSHEAQSRKLWDEDDMRDYATSETAPLLAALQAIVARINGEFDNAALVAMGPLLPDTTADCLRFAQDAIKNNGGGQ